MFKPNLKRTFALSALAAFIGFSQIAEARTVVDAKGNAVELPEKVERVADLWHANNQIVLLLGGADKMVSTTNVIKANKWFTLVYPRAKELPAVTNGSDSNIEELLKLNPDVALTSNAQGFADLQKANIPAAYVMFQDFEGLKRTVKITADILGDDAPKVAEEYVKELDGNIAFINERVKNVPEEKRPVVLHISNANNLYKIDGGKSIIGDWVRKAGGRNALPDQANLVEVSMEEILAANPDVIIVGSSKAQGGVDKILTDPTWASISAVKNKKVFVNPTGTFPWDRYSAEEALQILWAAQKFHPELFKDVDMVQRTQDFYKKYYHYDLSKENAEQILQGLNPIEK